MLGKVVRQVVRLRKEKNYLLISDEKENGGYSLLLNNFGDKNMAI